MEIKFFVPGPPQALKRHRTFRTKTGFSINVDPSADAKDNFVYKSLNFRPTGGPIAGPLKIRLCFIFQHPKAHFNSKGAVKKHYTMTSKPDIDNLIKFVFDALNGIFYQDDSQFVTVTAKKKYGLTPGVNVLITDEITEIPF